MTGKSEGKDFEWIWIRGDFYGVLPDARPRITTYIHTTQVQYS